MYQIVTPSGGKSTSPKVWYEKIGAFSDSVVIIRSLPFTVEVAISITIHLKNLKNHNIAIHLIQNES